MTTKSKAKEMSVACETAVNAYLLARVFAENKREQVDAVKRDCVANGEE
jgi:hypothetical protein